MANPWFPDRLPDGPDVFGGEASAYSRFQDDPDAIEGFWKQFDRAQAYAREHKTEAFVVFKITLP